MKEEKEPAERPYARLERTLTLPEGVNLDRVEARYHTGVLEVHLLKNPEVKPRLVVLAGPSARVPGEVVDDLESRFRGRLRLGIGFALAGAREQQLRTRRCVRHVRRGPSSA